MPENTQKPPELLQAQVAAFVAETVPHHDDRRYLYSNLGTIAAGDRADVTRTLTRTEYHSDQSGNVIRLPVGDERIAATAQDYINFLHSVGGSKYEGIEGRAALLAAYDKFKPAISKLKGELSHPRTRKDHPNLLGVGGNAIVFSIIQDNKEYAVRVPDGTEINPSVIDDHLAGAVLGRGVTHLEQIVAASYEDGVTVAEVMPGRVMGELTLDNIRNVTDSQIAEFVDTLITVREREIDVDPKPSNLLYDAKHGYGLVDYHASKDLRGDAPPQTLGVIIGWMATALENSGRYDQPHKLEFNRDDYETSVAYAKANYDVLTRYRNIVQEKLDGNDRHEALRQIDEKLSELSDRVFNPNWAAEETANQLAMKQERERMEAEASTDEWI